MNRDEAIELFESHQGEGRHGETRYVGTSPWRDELPRNGRGYVVGDNQYGRVIAWTDVGWLPVTCTCGGSMYLCPFHAIAKVTR